MRNRLLISGLLLIILIIIITAIVVSLSQPSIQQTISIASQVPSSTLQQITETLDEFTESREEMVRTQIEARGIDDAAILESMRVVPRHEFVLERYLNQAYADHPLPIEYGQTISQPYIVALMTSVLEMKPGDRVLEVGTGSGYQAAVLAELDLDVYTIEIIPELAIQAQESLASTGYTNIKVLNSDGYYGWDEYAPYDAIIVTAAPDHLPQPLINQLAEGGRLVIPIGPIGAVQTLWLFEKVAGEPKAMNLGPVRFVPFTGEH